jgi:hypothetical protein
MAKSFNKKPAEYLRLPSTEALIKELQKELRNMGKSLNGDAQPVTLIITERGGLGSGGGSWLHEDLALDYAQWLSIIQNMV